MDQIVVKTEVQSNGEILLYYVDENGQSQEGVLTTIENIDNDSEQIQDQDASYMLESYEDLVDDPPPLDTQIEEELSYTWSDEDTKRLLIFFNDNKISFISGSTQKRHLWAVACKTMLIGKDYQSCEEKFAELKAKYCEIRGYIKKGVYVKWPFLDLCHKAFRDDPSVLASLDDKPFEVELKSEPQPKIAVLKQETICEQNGILSIKQMSRKSPDEQVKQMLNIYLKHKDSFQKEHWRRDLWDKIAEEMGEEDSEYLQKRFLNFKQHYITMLLKKKEQGSSSVNWPYMEIFDKIYGDDASFHKKYFNTLPKVPVDHSVQEHEWTETQKIILAKYYFDCYEEFEDYTIPDKFLWTEVGRLIDKKPETCENQYQILRNKHLEKYLAGNYSIQKRMPIAIIFDNIILRDVKIKLNKMEHKHDLWKQAHVDVLVLFFNDNTVVFKDQDCHFVCWAAIAYKLKKSIESCKQKWDEMVALYNNILENKKEDPDMEIDWRYIELFDHIFDYGMDGDLLKGYDTSMPQVSISSEKVAANNHCATGRTPLHHRIDNSDYARHAYPPRKAKKIIIKEEKVAIQNEKVNVNVKPEPDDNLSEPRTDPRSAKILEYYLKNKDKFLHVRSKLALWEVLAKQIGMNSTQCAHRFRTLKQIYIDHIQKQIDKPRLPVTWPYYGLCKKVFGYRLLKNKLKAGKNGTDNDDWLAREIKLLITFFSKNFNEISRNVEDISKWTPLATELGKSEKNCKDKFVELRRSYRKLKTMRTKNPGVNISWSYFYMFDSIYNLREGDTTPVKSVEEEHLEGTAEEEGEDDYECIIVLQDGQNIKQVQDLEAAPELMDSSELIQQIEDMPQISEIRSVFETKPSKWTKRMKKRLLIFYINYIRTHRGKEIDPKQMWTEIAPKFANRSPVKCRKMFATMKNSFKRADETVKKNSPYSYLLEQVLKLKPNFVKTDQSKRQQKTYKDFPMSSEKVNLALEYYLEHIEEFVNPKFEKKYLWTQLANHISEPLTKVYNKINYLKQAFNILTEEIAGERTEFCALLKEIITKEVAVKVVLDVTTNPDVNDDECTWSDDETEQLMFWYLTNLDKFKSPKYNRRYLWLEAANNLGKSPLGCSKKMSEIRSQYRNMVRQDADTSEWRFFDLCQKIYGTGKKSNIG